MSGFHVTQSHDASAHHYIAQHRPLEPGVPTSQCIRSLPTTSWGMRSIPSSRHHGVVHQRNFTSKSPNTPITETSAAWQLHEHVPESMGKKTTLASSEAAEPSSALPDSTYRYLQSHQRQNDGGMISRPISTELASYIETSSKHAEGEGKAKPKIVEECSLFMPYSLKLYLSHGVTGGHTEARLRLAFENWLHSARCSPCLSRNPSGCTIHSSLPTSAIFSDMCRRSMQYQDNKSQSMAIRRSDDLLKKHGHVRPAECCQVNIPYPTHHSLSANSTWYQSRNTHDPSTPPSNSNEMWPNIPWVHDTRAQYSTEDKNSERGKAPWESAWNPYILGYRELEREGLPIELGLRSEKTNEKGEILCQDSGEAHTIFSNSELEEARNSSQPPIPDNTWSRALNDGESNHVTTPKMSKQGNEITEAFSKTSKEYDKHNPQRELSSPENKVFQTISAVWQRFKLFLDGLSELETEIGNDQGFASSHSEAVIALWEHVEQDLTEKLQHKHKVYGDERSLRENFINSICRRLRDLGNATSDLTSEETLIPTDYLDPLFSFHEELDSTIKRPDPYSMHTQGRRASYNRTRPEGFSPLPSEVSPTDAAHTGILEREIDQLWMPRF